MARLHLELLGGFSVRLDGDKPCILPARKSQALLAYLATPPGRLHARDKLTTLLWGDYPETQARQSFRQALAGLRRALGPSISDVLLIRGDVVALDAASVRVDVGELEAASGGDARSLERAAVCYKGEFLEGLRIDEPAFEDWRAIERERLRGLALKALMLLLKRQLAAGPADAALDTASRLLAIDPLREDIHRAAMQLLLREGRRAAALRQYQICVDWLERELGAEPEEETRALYRNILRATATPQLRGALGPVGFTASGDAFPIFGRDAEVERLRHALAALLDLGGRAVLVTGEAGIGKSRLLQEFGKEASSRGLRVAVTACHESEQILPLRPWADALRPWVSGVAVRERLSQVDIAQLSRVFPELLAADDAPILPGEQLGLLFEALVQLLRVLTAEQPLILLVEDLHWADSLSARFLAFLARRIGPLPMLVVGTLRPEDLIDHPILARALDEIRSEHLVEDILLGPLPPNDARHLAEAVKAVRRDWKRIIGEILEVSEGNPFVIVESIRAARDRSDPATPEGLWLSGRIEDYVVGRLDRLNEGPKAAVATAAVIGREFPFSLLAAAAGLDDHDSAAAVEELVRRRILVAVGDRLDFAHDWIRRVAYDRVLLHRRQLLHARVGRALERLHHNQLDEVTDQLGHHYSRADEPWKAVTPIIRFAELAVHRYALEDALKALRQAAELAETLPPTDRDRAVLDIALRQAFVLSSLARPREVRELLQAHANLIARVADPSLASEYHFRVSLTSIYLGERVASRNAAQQALITGDQSGDSECIGKALYVLSLTDFEAGKPRDGILHASRAITLLERLPAAQIWLGLTYYALALNHLIAGTLGSALEATDRADAVGGAAAWPRVQALAGYAAAWAHALRGDTDAAIATAERSLGLSRDPMAASLVSGALGLAHIEKGDGATAIGILTKVVEQLRKSPVRSGEVRHMILLAEAQLLTGKLDVARRTASHALEMGRADNMTFNIGLALRAMGRVALTEEAWPEAAASLRQSQATFAGCGAAFEAARTGLELLRLPPMYRCDWDAEPEIATALSAFEAAPAPRWVAELQRRIRGTESSHEVSREARCAEKPARLARNTAPARAADRGDKRV